MLNELAHHLYRFLPGKAHPYADQNISFEGVAARRIAKRLELHHTPNHGSWLNMAEIELSVLSADSCLKQRLPDTASKSILA